MKKDTTKTPRSRIVSSLRTLWLRSRERAARLKMDGYTCQQCGRKQSKRKGHEVKVEVHHRHGIDWSGIADLIRERILVDPGELETVCRDCHKKEHKKSPA